MNVLEHNHVFSFRVKDSRATSTSISKVLQTDHRSKSKHAYPSS